MGGDFCDGCRPLFCLLRGGAGSRPEQGQSSSGRKTG
nr:MAG TPA: hypothetical protein [Caudoviricetes sp.]